ncbi:uncharacterized protein LOC131884113 [Tigriopus californicus]|uniref:uncharacterized protein LOC131884113 n=1 Tax=Tigriopus californicus TaxID=6832 RepID=UPI0027D9EAEC|nr:uncharacterized protein LOC131884113 [Tigriopus californicus]
MMKVQTVCLGILCWTWCWIPIILAKHCSKTFQPRVKEHIQFSFPKVHEDFFNFQAIKVQFAKRAKHLFCPEEEPLKLVLRYRKVGTKKWPNSIDIDLDSKEVIIEEGIESCSTYQFQLRGSAGTASLSNTRVGKFDTGPRQLMRSSIETTVDQNWVGFDWANYTDNCSEGIVLEHQKKTALTPHAQHNIRLVECKKDEIILAPKFNEQRDLDPECLVVKTNARGSKAWDQENDHLDSTTDGYDLVEEILNRNSGSPIQPSTASTQGEVETTWHSVDHPNISQDTPSTPIEVLDVTITESSSTGGPEDIDFNLDEEVDVVQEEEFQYDFTSPDPISPTYNGSVDEDIHLDFNDDNVTDSNGTDQSDDKEKGQLYDSYDHYGPALLEEFDLPVTTTEMSQTNGFTANLARTGNMNESIPRVVHASSGPSWLILLLVFPGMIAVLAAVFFGTAAYIRIRKDSSEMTPEWESPTVKEPLQLNSNSNQEDITFTNENYKTNPKNDVEHETNF